MHLLQVQKKNKSLIAISTGLLQNMNNNETEAVIAHEISHIANGDMVTMALIQGIVNTFVIFFSRLLARITINFVRSERNIGTNSNTTIYYVMSTILELIFGILASIITLWFSRYREFRADAGSAKLVGKEKMISALQKLKSSHVPNEIDSIMTFFINGRNTSSFNRLFMSHPPLDKRIEALRFNIYLN